jgi:dihydroorotase-like cyclic amidohydrolase
MTTTVGTVLVRDAKERGISITAETCPQYLVFIRDDAEKQGPYLKMTPPLRTRDDVISLWRGLEDGTIDMVVTDHAPGTREEKEVGWKDIWKAWGGIPGVETLLPIMLSEGVNKGRITPMRLVEAMCQRPAEVFGLYPRKGALKEGSDGDLVIVDMKREVTIRAENLHYKVGWTPYEGMKVVGYPEVTVLRGEVVAEDGAILGRPGYGKFVPMR